jgi:hypothetical protein
MRFAPPSGALISVVGRVWKTEYLSFAALYEQPKDRGIE